MADTAFPNYVVGTHGAGLELWLFVPCYGFTVLAAACALVIWKRASNEKSERASEETPPEDGDAAPRKPASNRRSYDAPEKANDVRASARFSFRSQHRGTGDRESESTLSGSTVSKEHMPPVMEIKGTGRSSVATGSTNSGSHSASSTSRAASDETNENVSELTGSIAPSMNFNVNNRPRMGSFRRMNSKTQTDHSSAIPSVATTSRLHGPSRTRVVGEGTTKRIIFENVGPRSSRRQSFRRITALHNVSSMGSSVGEQGPAFSKPSNASFTSRNSRARGTTPAPRGQSSARGHSDVASSILEDPANSVDGPVFNRIHRRAVRRRFSSFSSSPSEPSVLPSIVDDISPNDAADADDPGKGNLFDQDLLPELSSRSSSRGSTINGGYGVKLGPISSVVESILDLVDLDEQVQMLLGSSFYLTFMALMDPLFRVAIAAFVSRYLGSESVIAFLLVALLLRLTNEEMAGSIVDALSSFIQACIYSNEGDTAFLAGQYIQLGLILQCLLGLPLLYLWAFYMYDVTYWLVQSESIATLAEIYTKAIVFKYILQAIGKTLGVLFQINGHETGESFIDMASQCVSLIVVGCIVGLVDEATLEQVAHAQVLVESAALALKLALPIYRGWLSPLSRGLFCGVAPIQNHQAFFSFAFATLPLFAGAAIEYGEWELMIFFLRSSGPAEVAAWLFLFSLWEVLEALTEGIGESSATLVASLLAISQPKLARRLSIKALYLSFVISVLVTGVFFMCGRPLLVILTSDPVLQHLMHQTLSFLGLANIAMSMLHLLWSIAGAQGRFRLATSAVFFSRWLVAMPAALVCIFVFDLDLEALSGCLVLGYTTATGVLAYRVLGCDWEALSEELRELHAPPPVPKALDEVDVPEDILEGLDDSDESSSDDDSGDDESSDEDSSDDDDESSDKEDEGSDDESDDADVSTVNLEKESRQ